MKKKTVATEKKRNSKSKLFFLIWLVLTQFSNFFLSYLMKLFKGALSRFFQLYNKNKTLETRVLK